ncbi:MAG: DNA mismatch repair endonuclease MutL [Acidobacteriota bacterium]
MLPDILAHKIAAGEIVERPASVVKELLENALDAQSTQVTIEVEAGGKRLIGVRDNGIGMSAEDAKLAFQHHATSKIKSFEDLSRIKTLGFRGEALPSIASVSRLRLRTVDGEAVGDGRPVGTEIRFEAGKLLAVCEQSWPRGTEVTVEELFFNVPARRKFLRAVSTEMSHISRQVTHYALAYPEVEFRLIHQQRPLLEATAAPTLEDRIYQILGESFLENLVPVRYEADGVRLEGFTSLPHEQRNSSKSQFFFVNRRVVRDRVLQHAVRLAYRDLIPSSGHPVVVLFVEIDPLEVDVNVHPGKIEVRFRQSNRVHHAVYHAIEEALARQKVDLASLARDLPLSSLQVNEGPAGPAGVARSVERFFQRRPDSSFGFPEFRHSSHSGLPPAPAAEPGTRFGPNGKLPADPQCCQIPETAYLSAVPVVLGQFVESFIVAADREGVMLVDQHVAHERILYDQSLRDMTCSQGSATQRLLVPVTLELTAQQKAVVAEILEHLNSNGFEVEWFGERTLLVKGVPSLAAACGEVAQLIGEIVDGADSSPAPGRENGAEIRRLRERIAIGLSCRAAIKINTPLSHEKMQWFIDELFRSANPYTCPHGRPIVLRLNIEDVLRGFKRI